MGFGARRKVAESVEDAVDAQKLGGEVWVVKAQTMPVDAVRAAESKSAAGWRKSGKRRKNPGHATGDQTDRTCRAKSAQGSDRRRHGNHQGTLLFCAG